MIKIKIILGSTRPNRQSEAVGKWIRDIASRQKNFDIEILDLRDYPLPFYSEPVGASGLKTVGYTNEHAEKWAKKIADADGYIFVAPEYNHGYSAVLKNALDYAYTEWNRKPVGFVSYGSAAGGSRAVEQLRLVAIELQMVSVRGQVLIPIIWDAFDENGGLKDPGDHYLHAAEGMLHELEWWAKTLKGARDTS